MASLAENGIVYHGDSEPLNMAMLLDQLRGWGLRCYDVADAGRRRIGSLRFVVLFGLSLVVPVVGNPRVLVAETQGFDITFSFGGGLTDSQKAIFNQAAATWEGVIRGYQMGYDLGGVEITAQGHAIDGVNGTLGTAGPTGYYDTDHFTYAASGVMNLDTADLASLESRGLLCDVIVHEMGHILGFGTLWGTNGLYANGSGKYYGANALAAYRTEFNQPNAAYVPVELGGGSGTADCHWNEGDGGTATGITDRQGRDMRYEIMTGWFNIDAPRYMSQTTIQSFADLGYVVVPEPGAFAMLLGMAAMLAVCNAGRRVSQAK